jgi:probable HAF family extracellular repeat protein
MIVARSMVYGPWLNVGILLIFASALPASAADESACGLSKPARYCLTDIGALLDSDDSFATGLNERGEVVGNFGDGRSFRYSDGTVQEIAPLPGDDAIGVSAINSAGIVVGNSVNLVAGSDPTPVIVQSGQTVAIPGLRNAIPYAINDLGQIAGAAHGIGAFVYSAGSASSIGDEGAVAYGINSNGDVVGILGNGRAFVHGRNGTVEIGTLPGDVYSSGNAINTRGQIAAISGTTGANDGQAILYSSETGFVALGRLTPDDTYSVATAINACRHVVGFSGSASDFYATTEVHAFLYVSDTMTDLNTRLADASGITVTAASAINDHGQIAGRGAKNGSLHAVLLTPRNTNGGCENDLRSPKT